MCKLVKASGRDLTRQVSRHKTVQRSFLNVDVCTGDNMDQSPAVCQRMLICEELWHYYTQPAGDRVSTQHLLNATLASVIPGL